MRKWTVILMALLWVVVALPVGAEDADVPDKAECTTCSVRGASHGAEEVAAWRDYQGDRYYFCSPGCAEAFDGFPSAYIEHPIPRAAPNATVTMLSGETLELESLKGNVVLVDFWATWCQPCRKSMPMLNELHQDSAESPLKVIGISIDEKADEVVPKFVDKQKLQYPIAVDTGQSPAWYAYHVAAIPAMFLIDVDGQIVAEWRGEVEADEVRNTVNALVAKRSQSN